MRPGLGQDLCVGRQVNDSLPYVFCFVAGAALSVLSLPSLPAVLSAAWWGAVVIVIRSDLRTLTIPDEASAAIAALGILQAHVHADAAGSAWTAVFPALLKGVLAFAVFWLIKMGYRRWRGHEGLGLGDVKLAGACAIWINTSDQIMALEIAATSAVVLAVLKGVRGKAGFIPFGAFLAPAAWLVFIAHTWFATP